MSYPWRNHVFIGDTLLINGCGCTFDSGRQRQRAVPQHHPGAGSVLPSDNSGVSARLPLAQPAALAQKKSATRGAGRSEAEFVTPDGGPVTASRPQRMDEAVPANLHSGLRHDADGASLNAPRAAEGWAGDISAELARQWSANGRGCAD